MSTLGYQFFAAIGPLIGWGLILLILASIVPTAIGLPVLLLIALVKLPGLLTDPDD